MRTARRSVLLLVLGAIVGALLTDGVMAEWGRWLATDTRAERENALKFNKTMMARGAPIAPTPVPEARTFLERVVEWFWPVYTENDRIAQEVEQREAANYGG